MRILVTGATGFIGSNLAQSLAAQGYDTVVTGRAETEVEIGRLKRLQSAGVSVRAGSLLDAGFAAKMASGCDAVIHLAAAQHEGNVPDSYFHDINVVATRLLVEAAIAGGVRRFVYGSTIGVYGEAAEGKLDENSPLRPANIYGRTKAEAESVVSEYASRIQTCIARISETYGPGDFRLLKLFRAIARGRFIVIGPGTNLRQVIYVDDLIRALLLTVQQPSAVGEAFVLCGADVMNTNEMVQKVAVAVGHRPPRIRVPVWPFRAAAAVMEATLSPLGIQPPLTQRRLDFFTKSFVFSTEKCRKVLDFVSQTPFEVGAAKTAKWYRDTGYL
jgi:dihydroflavonol-4-reductase